MRGLGLGLGLGLGTHRKVGGLLPQTKAYIAAMTVKPTATQEIAINNRIKALLPVWSKLVSMCFHDVHDEQAARINVINPSTILTNTNLDFTAYSGYKGSAYSFIDSAVIQSSHPILSQNIANLHIGTWVSGSAVSGFQSFIGNVQRIESSDIWSAILKIGTVMYIGLNSGTSAMTASEGYLILSRNDGDNNRTLYHNGSIVGSLGGAASVAQTTSYYFCNTRGRESNANTGIYKVSQIGTNLLASEVATIYNAINDNPILEG